MWGWVNLVWGWSGSRFWCSFACTHFTAICKSPGGVVLPFLSRVQGLSSSCRLHISAERSCQLSAPWKSSTCFCGWLPNWGHSLRSPVLLLSFLPFGWFLSCYSDRCCLWKHLLWLRRHGLETSRGITRSRPQPFPNHWKTPGVGQWMPGDQRKISRRS